MSTDSDQVEHGRPETLISPRGLPSFVGFAVRTSADSVGEPLAAETVTLHPQAVAGRRETFRLGRLAAHAALQEVGLDTSPILSGANREPIWPTGACGSISHVEGIGVALVAPCVRTDGVGIDIEARREAPELEDQVPRPEEKAWLDNAPASERDRWLLALFSAKESVFKALYPRVGFFFGFEAASLTPNTSGFTASLVEDIDNSYPPTRGFEVGCEWFGTTVLTWVVLPKTA